MLVILVKAYLFIKFISYAVDPDPCISGFAEALEKLAEFTLLASYYRSIDYCSRTFGIYLKSVDDLIDPL